MPGDVAAAMLDAYKLGSVTKLQGHMMKFLVELDKDDSKLEGARSKIVDAIKTIEKQINKECGDAEPFKYQTWLPTATRVATDDVISMKRGRQ